jgi:hypothetical protein
MIQSLDIQVMLKRSSNRRRYLRMPGRLGDLRKRSEKASIILAGDALGAHFSRSTKKVFSEYQIDSASSRRLRHNER